MHKIKGKKIKSRMTISLRSEAYRILNNQKKLERNKVSYREDTHW